ncbi:MAG: DUF1684 domain-containing protein, partial [Actinomycetota bacterium]|nr:DUF1684 domain-containing protein [Actinomycetota bacterium]
AELDPRAGWDRWRSERDRLFREHPQSPLPSRGREEFTGLDYFDYDPVHRVEARLEAVGRESYEIATSGTEPMRFDRIGLFRFELAGRSCELEAYWLSAYGGGVFVPFADATSGKTTYGAGRYLLDTVKGSDLGASDDGVVLDFNFAYNPSCSYDPRWVCPLATPANRLAVAVEAGEKLS